MRTAREDWKVGNAFNRKDYKLLTLLYFCRDGVFRGGPAKGMLMLVSRNFSDNRPPITVPYLHPRKIHSNFRLCSTEEDKGVEGREQTL